jgi:peptidoglycan/LPS O-acetylase OafA/YrhL
MRARRYESLDALRGVAALAVVIYHLSQVKLEPPLVTGGYLAVDFFFVLSGFVVALAYEDARRRTLSWEAFLVKRVTRLYPLALLGVVFGLIVTLMKWHWFPDRVDTLPQILISGFFNSLMLPTVFGSAGGLHEIFPGNGPLWTLFQEMAVNLLWAWLGIRMKTWRLAAVALVSGAVLAVMATHFQTANMGYDLTTFWGGVARVCFGFPLGVVIYRLHLDMAIPAGRYGTALLGVMMLIVFVMPMTLGRDGVPWRDLVSILLVLPCIVVLGVGQVSGGRIGAMLGALSYPVYALHYPVLLLASGLSQTVLSRINVHVISVCTVVLVVALGAAANRFYDEPVRRMLSRRTRRVPVMRDARV